MSDAEGVGTSRIEEKVREIWCEILRVPDGLEHATFFELEGESIAAVRLASRVEEEFGVIIDVGDIFEEDPNLSAFTSSVTEKAAR